MNVLLDTNIILDIALKRNPFFDQAARLFELIDLGELEGKISASTVTDIYYISRKVKGHLESIAFLKDLVEIIDVVGIDKTIILSALHSGIGDFEDAIQVFAAEVNGIDVIITRNKKDFKDVSMEIQTPSEFLANYQ